MRRTGLIAITNTLFIDEAAIEESFIRSSGRGGQNINKVATAVQLRFLAVNAGLPTDVYSRLLKLAGQRATKEGHILIEASRFRTQERNREDARNRLLALLRRASLPPPPARRATKATKGSIERRLKAKTVRGRLKRNRGPISIT